MQNDVQAKLPPATRVEVRQPYGGAALLFFIDKGSLCMAKEIFHPAHGWQRRDLSRTRIAHDLPTGVCTGFASALSVPARKRAQVLHLALVVRNEDGDHLYLCLSNPAANTAWSVAPLWMACPFDAGPAQRLAITQVQIGDASDRPFVVVDAVIDPDGPTPQPGRYVIDARGTIGPRWLAHKLPLASTLVRFSCLGRCRGGWDVDGLYLRTAPTDDTEGDAQLLYAPLYNPFNLTQPCWARRLSLPGAPAAEAIAACRNADDTSDLYAIAGGTLYYFSSANQNEGAQALVLLGARAFEGVRTLFAAITGGRVTLWGLNGAGQVICTSAPQVYVADPAAWSTPAVILAQASAIAPSPDGDGADYTLFVQTADGLRKVSKAPGSSHWTSQALGTLRV